MAFLIGLGIAATNTVSGMYIVEFHDKSQWDARMGFLQTTYGTGQFVGLLLAVALVFSPASGMVICAVLMIPGVYFGIKGLPKIQNRSTVSKPILAGYYRHHTRALASLLTYWQRFKFSSFKKLASPRAYPFVFHIIGWFMIMMGNWLIYNLYPLFMLHVYDVHASLSSLYYGIGAGIGILAYPLAGTVAKKVGEMHVLLTGSFMCLVSLLGLTLLALMSQTGVVVLLVPIFFILLPIAWSPLIVIGLAISPKLTDMAQGESLGLLNGATALASLISAFVAGVIASSIGYFWIVVLALIFTIGGIFIQMKLYFGMKTKLAKIRAEK